MGWLGRHWKGILTFAVSTAAFIAITAATGGLGAPALVAFLAGGVGSGVIGALVGDWLDKRKPGLDLLWAGLISGAITLATLGIAKAAAPYVAPLLERLFAPAAKTVADASVPVAEKATSTLTKALEPALKARPVEPVAPRPTIETVTPRTTPHVTSAPPEPPPSSEPASRGVVGVLEGEPPNAGARLVNGMLPRDPQASLDGLVHPEETSLGGRGTFKETFRLKPPNGDYVMGLAKDDVYGQPYPLSDQTEMLTREVKELDDLAARGVPVEKVVGQGIYNGRAAYVKEAYKACSADDTFATEGYKSLNETSLQDLKNLKQLLAAKKLYIGDLQLGIKADGHVIVTDPLGVKDGTGLTGADLKDFEEGVASMNDRLDNVIQLAEQSLVESLNGS